MSNLTPFSYGEHQVRVITIDNEPWFVGADIARVLDIAAASGITRMVDDEDKGSHEVETPGGTQRVTIVNESGMYTALMRSNNPAAKPFRRWVTAEVLPQIRKTGSYGQLQQFQIPQTLPEALRLAADESERRMLAEAKVAELTPKADYVDRFVADEDLRLLRNVAKSINVAEGTLRDALIRHGWIYTEHSTRWSEKEQKKVDVCRYSPMADKRQYFRPIPNHEAPRFKGEVMHTLKITPTGAAAIERAARRWGLVPSETEGTAA